MTDNKRPIRTEINTPVSGAHVSVQAGEGVVKALRWAETAAREELTRLDDACTAVDALHWHPDRLSKALWEMKGDTERTANILGQIADDLAAAWEKRNGATP